MNKIILLGRFTRDPEVRYTSTGKVVCQGTIAVDRPFVNQGGQHEADFIPIVIWGKQAEVCGNSFAKGQRILIEGRLQIRSYDAKDGSKRYATEVIVSNFNFIEKKISNTDTNTNASASTASQADRGIEAFGAAVPFDEELPF